MSAQEQGSVIPAIQVPVAVTIDGTISDQQFCDLFGCTRFATRRWRRSGKLGYLALSNRIRYTAQHVEDFKARINHKTKSR